MRRARIETIEQRLCRRRLHCDFVILASERAHGLQVVEVHHSDEFDFFAGVAAQQLDAAIADDIARSDTGEDFLQ